MTLGWGIVGPGSFADRSMAPAINASQDGRVVAVASRDQGRAAAFARAHGADGAYDRYEQLLADPAVDVVYIATPNTLHFEQALAAAAAGKHVLCDKPLATSVDDARRMVEAFERAGRKLGTNFENRHNPVFQEVKRLLDEGAIGDVLAVDYEAGGTSAPTSGWRSDPSLAGLGVIYNIGVHAYDALRYFLDAEVADVMAVTDAPIGQIELLAMSLLRFENGPTAYVHVSQNVPNIPPDFHLYGRAGRLSGLRATRPSASSEVRLLTAAGEQVTTLSERSMYQRTVEAFNDAILQDREPSPSGLDGLRSVQIADAIARSARDGVRVRPDA